MPGGKEKKMKPENAERVKDFNSQIAQANTFTELWKLLCTKRPGSGYKMYPKFLDTAEPYNKWSPEAKIIFLEIYDRMKLSDKSTKFKDEKGVFVSLRAETLSDKLNIPISRVKKALIEIERRNLIRRDKSPSSSKIYPAKNTQFIIPEGAKKEIVDESANIEEKYREEMEERLEEEEYSEDAEECREEEDEFEKDSDECFGKREVKVYKYEDGQPVKSFVKRYLSKLPDHYDRKLYAIKDLESNNIATDMAEIFEKGQQIDFMGYNPNRKESLFVKKDKDGRKQYFIMSDEYLQKEIECCIVANNGKSINYD